MTELERAEHKAIALFSVTALVAAITVGAMLVSGWSGGRLRDDIEVLFWVGAGLGAIGIGLLGIASLGTSNAARTTALTRLGLVLFLLAPVLTVTAVFVDFWI